MKKLCKALLGVVCVFCIMAPGINVQAEPSDKTLSELEEKIKKYDEIISKYDNKLKEMDNDLIKKINDVDKKSNDLDKKINDVDKKLYDLEIFRNIAIGLLSVLGISCITGYFEIKKKMNKKIDDKLDTYLDSNVEKLNNLIDIKDTEEKLKKDKKIIVLSKSESDKKTIKRILKEFEQVTYENIDNIPKKLSQYDVVFLNNNSGSIEHDQILSVINDHKDSNYIYYSTNGKPLEGLTSKENITFASTKITLCTNLMNLLKYQGW